MRENIMDKNVFVTDSLYPLSKIVELNKVRNLPIFVSFFLKESEQSKTDKTAKLLQNGYRNLWKTRQLECYLNKAIFILMPVSLMLEDEGDFVAEEYQTCRMPSICIIHNGRLYEKVEYMIDILHIFKWIDDKMKELVHS